MKYEVITFGSATLDIFAETATEQGRRICNGQDCEEVMAYPSGEKILVSELHLETGGGGTNTAACISRLGIPVAFGGCVGEDGPGDDILRWLSNHGIDFVGMRSKSKTNLSIVLDSKLLHDRTLLVYKGASDDLQLEGIDLSSLDATWYYFSSLVGHSYHAMLQLMRHARQNGIAVAFNPSSYQTREGIEPLREAIELSQLLVMNREEASMLVGDGLPAELCLRLRQEGAEIVLITDGPDGSTLLYGDSIYSGRPGSHVDVVETTGAGDCFAASFLSGLVLGRTPEDSLRLAFINTESLIGIVGAKNGLLDLDELLRRLGVDDHEITVRPLAEVNL